MREDAFTDVEDDLREASPLRNGGTGVLEGLITDDLVNYEAEVEAETEDAGQCDH